jgi:hypothetical protein
MDKCFVCGELEPHQNHQYEDAAGKFISRDHIFARSRSEYIVGLIVEDFTDRRGLRQEWEQIDDDIQQEIRKTWEGLVEKGLAVNG